MSNQQSMFEPPEERAYGEDPSHGQRYERQTWAESPVEGQEGYAETYTESSYLGETMRSLGDGKIRPRAPRPKARPWLIALVVGIPLLFFLALGGMGFAFGRTSRSDNWRMGDWHRDHYAARHDWGMRAHGPFPQTLNVGAQPRLVINDTVGDVLIRSGDVGQVVVQAGNNQDDDSGGRAVAVPTTYDPQSNTVNITLSNSPGLNPGSPLEDDDSNLYVTVPATSNIQVNTSDGNIDVTNVSGQLSLNSDSGAITVADSTGQLEVASGHGDVDIRNAVLSGQSKITVNSGDINFNGSIDPQGTYQITTNSGDVQMALPGNSAFALNTSTSSGKVYNEFNSEAVGSGQRAPLSVTTKSGSIAINRS